MDLFDLLFAALLVALGGIGGFYFTRAARWLKAEYVALKTEFSLIHVAIHDRADEAKQQIEQEARDIRNTVHNRITQAEQKFEQIKKAL